MPPPVWVFLAGTVVSTLILKLDKPYLINVPDSLKHGIVFPHFGDAFAHAALLLPLAYLVVTLLSDRRDRVAGDDRGRGQDRHLSPPVRPGPDLAGHGRF